MKKFLLEDETSSFDRLWDTVAEARQPVVVSREGAEPVIMMPLSEWRSVQKTLHLFRSPANGLRLLSALQRVEAQSIRDRDL
ncbi:MAG: type II toxin-antitoxin system Phd/YefM family antitoxin [Chthoniobacterales bacterium]